MTITTTKMASEFTTPTLDTSEVKIPSEVVTSSGSSSTFSVMVDDVSLS